MSWTARLRRLSWAEALLLARAAALLAALRLALALAPFGRVLHLVERSSEHRGATRSDAELERWSRAITFAGRRIAPARPCLPQALLAFAILRRAGRPAELRIGVMRGAAVAGGLGEPVREAPVPRPGGKAIQAHAWVESEGRVVVGGRSAPERYVPFPSLRGYSASGRS